MTSMGDQFREAALYFNKNRVKVKSSIEKFLDDNYQESQQRTCEDCGSVYKVKDEWVYTDIGYGQVKCCKRCYDRFQDQVQSNVGRENRSPSPLAFATTSSGSLATVAFIGSVNPYTNPFDVSLEISQAPVDLALEVEKLQVELLQAKRKLEDKQQNNLKDVDQRKTKRRIEL